MKHIVVGTSGHIDHGKSALVKALTGVDPDRFEEEKRRGITIDLGFAHYIWNEVLEVAFVDVPGHERFVHNMLAGVGGIQLLILVVAGDEGVMPQTREHLHICNLLGTKHGLVVITRSDLADEEMIELVREEVQELVADTFLEDQPVIVTSAVEKTGLEELRETIAQKAELVGDRTEESGFRLPVDRKFTLKGFGTVVTGTVLAGNATTEDPLLLYPQQVPLKVRGFQVHQQSADQIVAGQRSAINLAGIHKDEIHRGNQIATPGKLVTTRIIEVELNTIADKTGILQHRSKIRFFSNAQEVTGRLYITQDFDPQKSDTQFAQIRLEEPITCCYGDRFIIRNLSPVETIGGGRIIAPFGNRSRRNKHRLEESLTGLAAAEETERIREAVFLSGTGGIQAGQLPPLVGCGAKTIKSVLQKLSSGGEIVGINPDQKKYIHHLHSQRVSGFFAKTLKSFHEKNPEKPGALGSDFYGKMSRMYSPPEVLSLLNWSVRQKTLVQNESFFHLPGFQGGLNPKQKEQKSAILALLKISGFQPPGLVNLADELSLPQKELEKLLKIGISEKWVVRVKDDLWYHPDAIEAVKEALYSHFEASDTLTVIEFKDLLKISRKHAIGLLEYFDSNHLTRRVENHRILR